MQYDLVYQQTIACVPAGSKVLDWGCGGGHFSYFLLRSGYKLVSFSLEDFPNILEPFRNSFEFIRGSIGEPRLLPFGDEQFDAVFSIGVLEHVRETGGSEPESLREIHRIPQTRRQIHLRSLPEQINVD